MRPRGFTLIEILIAVVILGIVLSTVYASYIGTSGWSAQPRTMPDLRHGPQHPR